MKQLFTDPRLFACAPEGKLKHAPPMLANRGGACFSLPSRMRSMPGFSLIVLATAAMHAAVIRGNVVENQTGHPHKR